jgi:hypothetical protein
VHALTAGRGLHPRVGDEDRRGIDLSYVAGFRAWLQLNRVPRKGEGMRILAPVTVKERDE